MSLMLHELLLSPYEKAVVSSNRVALGVGKGVAYAPVVPATAPVGSIAIYFVGRFRDVPTAPADWATPAGWTKINTHVTPLITSYGIRYGIYCKIITAADIGAPLISLPAEATTSTQSQLSMFAFDQPVVSIRGSGSVHVTTQGTAMPPNLTALTGSMSAPVVGDHTGAIQFTTSSTPIAATYAYGPEFFTPTSGVAAGKMFQISSDPTYNLSTPPMRQGDFPPATSMNVAAWAFPGF